MGGGKQKVNKLYESYYDYDLDDAKGLLEECEPVLGHFFVEFQSPTVGNEIPCKQKKLSTQRFSPFFCRI